MNVGENIEGTIISQWNDNSKKDAIACYWHSIFSEGHQKNHEDFLLRYFVQR